MELNIKHGPLEALVRPSAKPAAPLLCFLHGLDEAAPAALRTALTLHGPLRAGNPQNSLDELVIVAPQLPRAGDIWGEYADEVRNLVLEQAARHACDASRLYLTGFSYGGNGVFDLALRQPSFWHTLWSVDPTRVPASDVNGRVWLSVGECSRHERDAYVRRLKLEPATSTPRGDRFWTDDGKDHVATATRAYSDERIYRWLSGAGDSRAAPERDRK